MAKPKFPHFTADEAEVLEEFIKRGIIKGEWKFDVRLPSEKAKYIEHYPEPWKSMWIALTSKRIDALCEDENYIHIIEVKRVMLHSGIGQLLMYKYLYEKHFKPKKPIKLWLIAKYHDPDVVKLCRQLNINTWWLI